MAFASSITEPPPTAKTASAPNSLNFIRDSSACDRIGLGITPQLSTHSTPFLFKESTV